MNRKGEAIPSFLIVLAVIALMGSVMCVICHITHPSSKPATRPTHLTFVNVQSKAMESGWPTVTGTDGVKYVIQPDKNKSGSGQETYEQIEPGLQYRVQVADYVRLVGSRPKNQYLPVLDGVDLNSKSKVFFEGTLREGESVTVPLPKGPERVGEPR